MHRFELLEWYCSRWWVNNKGKGSVRRFIPGPWGLLKMKSFSQNLFSISTRWSTRRWWFPPIMAMVFKNPTRNWCFETTSSWTNETSWSSINVQIASRSKLFLNSNTGILQLWPTCFNMLHIKAYYMLLILQETLTGLFDVKCMSKHVGDFCVIPFYHWLHYQNHFNHHYGPEMEFNAFLNSICKRLRWINWAMKSVFY